MKISFPWTKTWIVLGWVAIVLFVMVYGIELLPHHGPPVTVRWIENTLGQTGLIVLNIVIVLAFLILLPYRRPTKALWKSRGAFIAFVVALMTEMFGWLAYLAHLYMGLSCGYGESPLKIVRWAVTLILLFALVFCLTGFRDTQIQDCVIRLEFPLNRADFTAVSLKSLYFSTVTFTTLGFGDTAPYFPYTRIFAALESFLGAFTIAQLAWVLGRKYSAR